MLVSRSFPRPHESELVFPTRNPRPSSVRALWPQLGHSDSSSGREKPLGGTLWTSGCCRGWPAGSAGVPPKGLVPLRCEQMDTIPNLLSPRGTLAGYGCYLKGCVICSGGSEALASWGPWGHSSFPVTSSMGTTLFPVGYILFLIYFGESSSK